MRLDMEAVPKNKATPISLAQHTYWNLASHNSGTILDHSIEIWALNIPPVDQNSIPTGEILPVKGTPFDFTNEKKIGSSIHKAGLGYYKERFYTANYMPSFVGKGGAVYGNHSGLCLETQAFPKAINQPNFPSVIVRPGNQLMAYLNWSTNGSRTLGSNAEMDIISAFLPRIQQSSLATRNVTRNAIN
ncbi:galactose mutarotase-like superfamily protein [Actinidia rufa]|uniref:Galactose mutarotase-like superfamily protein n=1 Tax=Actinidia rufa TaxID=165716 RepID=A0A7J0DE83_9ERIC|nr:galactose mutarotase-like superfamily protein [Actinidia rufa]